MERSLTRPIAVLVLLLPFFTLHAALLQQDLSLATVNDPLIHQEIQELGLYPELMEEFPGSTLNYLAIRSSAGNQLEFSDDGIRIRIETQQFDHSKWVKHTPTGFRLEQERMLGWTPGEEHNRLSRVELVLDGSVIDLPTNAYTDIFDAPLFAGEGTVMFATAARSRDGWRTYVHLQAGSGRHAQLVTWVFDDGRYLFRVVDQARE